MTANSQAGYVRKKKKELHHTDYAGKLLNQGKWENQDKWENQENLK